MSSVQRAICSIFIWKAKPTSFPQRLMKVATPEIMAVTTLLKAGRVPNKLRYVNIDRQVLAQMKAILAQYPPGFGQ
jgi:hypothetical protein